MPTLSVPLADRLKRKHNAFLNMNFSLGKKVPGVRNLFVATSCHANHDPSVGAVYPKARKK